MGQFDDWMHFLASPHYGDGDHCFLLRQHHLVITDLGIKLGPKNGTSVSALAGEEQMSHPGKWTKISLGPGAEIEVSFILAWYSKRYPGLKIELMK